MIHLSHNLMRPTAIIGITTNIFLNSLHFGSIAKLLVFLVAVLCSGSERMRIYATYVLA